MYKQKRLLYWITQTSKGPFNMENQSIHKTIIMTHWDNVSGFDNLTLSVKTLEDITGNNAHYLYERNVNITLILSSHYSVSIQPSW